MKWYAKIIFRDEGIYTYSECETEKEANSFCNGFNAGKKITAADDDDMLEDYYSVVDQLKPIDE